MNVVVVGGRLASAATSGQVHACQAIHAAPASRRTTSSRPATRSTPPPSDGLPERATSRRLGAGGTPDWRREAPLAVASEADPGVVEAHAIPELAGDLLVVLVEPFAVVGELAAAHEVAVAQPDLAEPVGI